MRPYEDPTHVPVLLLKIITCAYLILYIGVPVVRNLQSGLPFDIPLTIAKGLSYTGISIALMFITRLALYCGFAFFWYILAAFAACSAFAVLPDLVGIYKLPTLPAIQIPYPAFMTENNAQYGWILGAIIGAIAVILVMRYQPNTQIPVPASPAAPSKPPSTPIDQLEERRKKLGLK